MKKRDWMEWVKRAGVRAGKTVAQSVIGGISATPVVGQMDWKYIISTAILAGILSMITSVAGLPELKKQSGTV